MEIVSSEEFNSVIEPLFLQGLIASYQFKEYIYKVVSQRFDYLKVFSNNYLYGSNTYFNIEPMELQNALVNASLQMGDDFLYLSFVGYNVEPDTPTNFKFPTKELLNEELYMLILRKEEAEIFFGSFFVYSPQGFWAASPGIDCYGTLGMTKDFLGRVRSIYPQLDQELDRQLLAFIGWCNDDPSSPNVWQYVPGDTSAYTGWCKGFMEYLCRRDISNDSKISENDADLIDIYRNIKV